MAWKTIVEANSLDEFQSAQPSVGDLPAGTPVKLTFEFPHWYPLAGIANIAEAEWVAQRFYDEAHIQVTDVNSPDAWHVVIEGKIVGTPVLAIVIAVGAIVVALGIFWVVHAKFEADIAETQVEAGKTQQETEANRIAFIEKYEPVYGSKASDWLAGVTKPPPEVVTASPSILDDLKRALPGIGIGTVVIIIGALVVLYLLRGRS